MIKKLLDVDQQLLFATSIMGCDDRSRVKVNVKDKGQKRGLNLRHVITHTKPASDIPAPSPGYAKRGRWAISPIDDDAALIPFSIEILL